MKNGRIRLLIVLTAAVLFLWGNTGGGISVVQAATGDTYVDGVLTYTEKDDGTLEVTGTAGYSDRVDAPTSVTIPSSYNGMAVTSMGDAAFADWYNLESIDIPNTITSIGICAFSYCESLTEVNIPDSVTSLGSNAFEFCEALQTIQLSDNISTIEENTFCNCSKLYEVTLPSNLTCIGMNAFQKTKLSVIVIPDGVVSIGYQAFYQCSALTDVTIPAGVTTIGSSAFPTDHSITIHCYADSYADQFLSENYSNMVFDRKTITNKVDNISIYDTLNNFLNNTTVSLFYGDTFQLSATVSPDNADKKTVAWSSDNPYITVDQNGLVTVNGVTGENAPATITATATDGGGATATFKITASLRLVSEVTLDKSNEKIKIGDTLQLTASVLPENATNKGITWSSTNTSAATVNSNGLVTAKAAGVTNIYATAQDGSGKDAYCIITVQTDTVSVETITLTPVSSNLEAGESTAVNAVVKPDNATNKTLEWTSSDNNIATVDNGTVTAKAVGTATITASAQDGSNVKGTCQITVDPTMVNSITLAESSKTMNVGDTYQVNVTSILPATATNRNLSWSSSNTSVAEVSTSGLVTAKASGTATITATAADGSGTTATCKITVNKILVNKITLSASEKTLYVGNSDSITATVKPENADNKNLTWTSTNPAVAEVTQDGVITAKAAGQATITAASNDGSNISASCTVSVNPVLVESITLTADNTELDVGGSVAIQKSIFPTNAGNQAVTWSSSNQSIVTVDENGTVSAVAPGTAVITATAQDGSGKSGTISITVKKILVGNITVSPSTVTLQAGGEQQLTAAVTPDNATNKEYTWSSNNILVATVDTDGKVTAVASGTTVITAKAKDGSNVCGTCTVTVEKGQDEEENTNILATGISLNSASVTLSVKETSTLKNTVTLTATITPQNATLKTVTWESSDESVATVEEGVVTAKKEGTTTITARTQDGTGKEATCEITVAAAILVSDVTISPVSSKNMNVNEELQLQANVSPADAANKEIQWSSSNSAVATVDASGKVTAVGIGTANIIALAADGSGKSATCHITVDPILVTNITLNETEQTLDVGDNLSLSVTSIEPAAATNQTVAWTSTDTSVATVSNGNVTAIAPGTAYITARANDGSNVYATCTITVKEEETESPVLVSSITLNAASKELKIDDVFQLTAAVLPENAENRNVVWNSDHPEIAVVDEKGYVTAKSAGEATITVSAADASGVTATCKVLVKQKETTNPGTTDPGTTDPGTINPGATDPGTQEPLDKGTVQTVSNYDCSVKVTSSGTSNPAVAYLKSNNTKAAKVTIPDTVTIDGITYKVTSVADKAFKGNKKLTTVTFGKNIVSIGKNAFNNCTKLSKVTIKSSGLTTIGANAFKGCTSLKSVDISSTVLNSIGANAFYGAKKLTSIKLKTTKLTSKKVGSNAFKGTSSKLTITVPSKSVKAYTKFMKTKGNKQIKIKK